MKVITSNRRLPGKIALELIMLGVAVFYLAPVWMVVVNSLKTKEQAALFRISWPETLHFGNYVEVFARSDALRGLWNGFLIGGVVVALSVLMSAMASYYLARRSGRTARFSYGYFVSGLIIPVAIVPTYFAMLVLELNNTFLGLMLIFTTYMLPMSIFLYTGFVKTIPRELDEAAVIDGCGPYRIFFRIILPLLGPVSMTVIIFNFLAVWNEVQAYLFFAGGDKWPLPMTVYLFFGKFGQSWHLVFANIIVTLIPCLVLFAACQKYIVSGMTAGAVKG